MYEKTSLLKSQYQPAIKEEGDWMAERSFLGITVTKRRLMRISVAACGSSVLIRCYDIQRIGLYKILYRKPERGGRTWIQGT